MLFCSKLKCEKLLYEDDLYWESPIFTNTRGATLKNIAVSGMMSITAKNRILFSQNYAHKKTLAQARVGMQDTGIVNGRRLPLPQVGNLPRVY